MYVIYFLRKIKKFLHAHPTVTIGRKEDKYWSNKKEHLNSSPLQNILFAQKGKNRTQMCNFHAHAMIVSCPVFKNFEHKDCDF